MNVDPVRFFGVVNLKLGFVVFQYSAVAYLSATLAVERGGIKYNGALSLGYFGEIFTVLGYNCKHLAAAHG